jgi:hypothetical protein
VDLYIHSPIRLHGVVLNWLSTGTTLPLPHSPTPNLSLSAESATGPYQAVRLQQGPMYLCSFSAPTAQSRK